MTKVIDKDCFKIVIIGDCGVGKSSIMSRQCDNRYDSSYISTMGVDFHNNNMLIEDKLVKLQIWDTSGQERFQKITREYYKSSDAIMIVFDVENKSSFLNVQTWFQNCKQYCVNENIQIYLIGNKSDSTIRVISTEEAIDCAEHLNIKYMETSAKTGFGIEECFSIILKSDKPTLNTFDNC